MLIPFVKIIIFTKYLALYFDKDFQTTIVTALLTHSQNNFKKILFSKQYGNVTSIDERFPYFCRLFFNSVNFRIPINAIKIIILRNLRKKILYHNIFTYIQEI